MIAHYLYLVIPEEDSGYDGGDVGHHQRHSYKDPLKLAIFRVREKSIKLFVVFICNKSCNTTYSVTRCTNEVKFIRQKKKFDVALKFF